MNSPVFEAPTGASETAAAIRAGRLTSQSLAQSCLARIEALDGELHAFAHLDGEAVLAAAREADRKMTAGEVCGPLHGVPVAVKDVIDAANFPCEEGSPIYAGRRPAEDAECVRQLKGAGAIIIGKTVTTELASLTAGPTRNPHNPAHTPGGSSSGSAAAVAAGMVPLALGTQTAGSVIRPASFCGVFGFKPTRGLISRRGVLLQSHTLDTVGVMARSLEDIALAADCMSAFDPGDEVSFPREAVALSAQLAQPITRPRLALCRTPAWPMAQEATRAAFEELIPQLDQACLESELPAACAGIREAQAVVQLAENALHYGPLFDAHAEQLSAGMRDRLKQGFAISARDYLVALTAREGMYRAFEDHYAAFDAILCPASPGPAPAGLESTGNPVFNGLWTFLGVPALAIPLFAAQGLPFGLQLVGRRHEEGRLLRAAAWIIGHLQGRA